MPVVGVRMEKNNKILSEFGLENKIK